MSEELPLLQFGGEPMRPAQTGYTTRDPYGAVVTNIPGGFSRIATDHLSGIYEVSATYQLDELQYQYWGAFYHTSLKEGAMPFMAELMLDTPVIQTYVCQIVAQPSKPRFLGSGYTEVTIQLEAEPIIDDAYNQDLIDILGELGHEVYDIIRASDVWYYTVNTTLYLNMGMP